MSAYKHIIDIVSRTKSILDNSKGSEYETTLFLNCCLGLLIIPQQENNRTKPISIRKEVSYEEWGIDSTQIKGDKATGDLDEIARHFRNSLSHGRFDIVECNPGNSIEVIRIKDYDSEKKLRQDKPNFDLTITISDFKQFVQKYASEVENTIKNL